MFRSKVGVSLYECIHIGLTSTSGSTSIELQRVGVCSAQGAVVTSEEQIFLKTEEKLISNEE